MPSLDPDDPGFDSIRYWRGPVWAVVNYMIGTGLGEAGHAGPAQRVRSDTRALMEGAGFFESYCPMSGRGSGGGDFSWTAAIWLHWASSG
jgi:glycogen debranching enzyme